MKDINTPNAVRILAESGKILRVFLPDSEPPAIQIAAENLTADIRKVCGAEIRFSSIPKECTI